LQVTRIVESFKFKGLCFTRLDNLLFDSDVNTLQILRGIEKKAEQQKSFGWFDGNILKLIISSKKMHL
jgi:hypothetical protein